MSGSLERVKKKRRNKSITIKSPMLIFICITDQIKHVYEPMQVLVLSTPGMKWWYNG
jgi:hypothetical protein